MNFKTFLNQYGLLIFVSNRFVTIMFNGLYLKTDKLKLDINEIDGIMFYEMLESNL